MEEERRGGACRWKQTGERALNRRLGGDRRKQADGKRSATAAEVSVLSRLPSHTYRFNHICTVTHQSAHSEEIWEFISTEVNRSAD